MGDQENEEWRAIPGWEGWYEASSLGRIRGVDRRVLLRSGGTRFRPGTVLKGRLHKGYRIVNLVRDFTVVGRPVHRLIAETFIGPLPEGLQTRHLDGNSLNNTVANLAYGTPKQNADDRRRHGTDPKSLAQRKTHCTNGHALVESNIYVRPSTGKRACRTCRRLSQQQRSTAA